MDEQTDNTATPAPGSESLAVCPHLALRDDPETRALYPRMDHVCRLPRVYPPSLQWQQRYCTGQHYDLCPHFRLHGKDASVPENLETKSSPFSWRRAALAGGALAVIGAGIVLSVNGSSAGQRRTPTPTPSATAVASRVAPAPAQVVSTVPVTATPSPKSTVEPATTSATVTPAPATPTPEPSATTAATPVVTPAAAPTTYTVADGDTLSSIAEKFNTTVNELITLNNISDPNVIHVGTVLKLPAAR